MKPSTAKEVREMYESTADSYSEMMDKEILLPIYADTLGRLQNRIANMTGAVIDTACGSGHMLAMFHELYDRNRMLIGVDLSPRMVTITEERLKSGGKVLVGDMRDLSNIGSASAVAVINFFAVHHLDPEGVQMAFREWHRVLCSGGQLLVAAWEGSGTIDYGDLSGIVALRYTSTELGSWAQQAGFCVSRNVVEPVEDFPMDAVYLECRK